jgi:N-acetylglucosaminyldiphosphoundecaprenol N-acetyl-beta-D-mannosaminyltransferase
MIRRANRVDFLGCPVDRVTTADALEWIADAVIERQPRQIAIVNANKLFLMARDPQLRRIVRHADLIVPEWAVVWGAQRLHLPALSHSGGVLIGRDLLPFAAERGLKVFFLGATPNVIDTLRMRLVRDFPRLAVAGFHHGYLTDAAVEDEALRQIQASRPDVLLVAMGSPAQERWIDRFRDRLNVPVSVGIGGSFDVLSGQKQDTPRWARGHGLEWLYRLAHDPARYGRRYAVTNLWFVAQLARHRMTGRPLFDED